MMHICPRLLGQTFDELPFEEEILAFLRFLGHNREIRKLTDVNINKLHQPWRSFAAVINKCLNGKSTGYDSLWLSQAQILWGMYHKKNVDFAYLLLEDFVYQFEHKNAKKSNKIYYPRFTKVIIHYFMTKDPSIPRRNKVNWHYVRDDQMFTTIKLVLRHQNTQQFGVMLHVELTNEDIRNSEAYKEYYAVASGAAPLKTKASVRKTKSSSDTTFTPPTAADKGTGIIPGVPDVPTEESDEEISSKSSDEDDDDDVDERSDDQDDDDQDEGNDDDQDTDNEDDKGNDDAILGLNVGSEEGHDVEDDEDELYRGVNINLEGRDSSSVSSQFVTSMLNPSPDAGIDSLFETTPQINVPTSTTVASLTLTAPTLPPLTIPTTLVEDYESDKIILYTHGDTVTLKRRRDDADKDEEPFAGSDRRGANADNSIFGRALTSRKQAKPPTPDRTWNKTLPATHGSIQPWISDLEKQADSRSSLNELMDTHVDFSAFLMNRLKVDTLTLKLLDGLTYEMMKGSCKSLVELEFFLEEVYKATTYQLDWNNPEGQQYPHNLLKPLTLIPNSRGCRVIPFDHFINNDLEYLCSDASSRKYTSSVTRQSQQIMGTSSGLKTWCLAQCGVKNRIIAVTELQIVEWHNYKHLDWIMVRRDDDKLCKFKEGDFKRLRIQDIKDMLLLLPEPKGSTQGYPLISVEVLSTAMHNPSQPLKVRKTLLQNSQRYTHFYQLSHSELVDIEKEALSSIL
nr:hypothetical protein [Tanacetum cinerariifolium]GEZ34046.1 hypothetical protein [Tanacetum cinerariifolium]